MLFFKEEAERNIEAQNPHNVLRRQEITMRVRSDSAKSKNGHKATCRRFCIHARQRVLYPATMKGLTRGEKQADLHFRKVSDMPCYTGHSNPGIHCSNANHLNGLWEGSNCTCEKCHTAACSYQRVWSKTVRLVHAAVPGGQGVLLIFSSIFSQ